MSKKAKGYKSLDQLTDKQRSNLTDTEWAQGWWDLNLLSNDRSAGVHIDMMDTSGLARVAVAIIVNGKPIKSYGLGDLRQEDAVRAACEISRAAWIFKKSAEVVAYAWGTDNAWHLFHKCGVNGSKSYCPVTIYGDEIFVDEEAKDWNQYPVFSY